MKRFIAGLVVLILLVPATAQAETGWRWKECRFQYHDGRAGWVRYEVKATIRCGAKKFGVSKSTAMYVAERESHFGQYATNSYSGACGVFQHIPRYFPGRLANVPDQFKQLGGSCYDARSNVMAALKMAQNGWGPWGL